MTNTDDATVTFCRMVRARSAEHRRAMQALWNLPGLMMSILRQELDSMVRVIFLLSQKDRRFRNSLLEATLNGKRWKRKKGKGYVTDREMVELANRLEGWTESVYRFGCAFIHLSNMHDYRCTDPIAKLSASERQAIVEHLQRYHGGPLGPLSVEGVAPILPMVFDKVSGNLERYLADLEADGEINVAKTTGRGRRRSGMRR